MSGSRSSSRHRWRSSTAAPTSTIVTGNGWYPRRAEARPAGAPVPRSAPGAGPARRSSATSGPCSSCRVFRRARLHDDRAVRRGDAQQRGLRLLAARRAWRASRSLRNDTPLGHYRIRTDSLSASDVRMHARHPARLHEAPRGDRRSVRARWRSSSGRSARFETELLAAEARLALEIADFERPRGHLGALHARRGGAALGVARWLARWAPKTLHARSSGSSARASRRRGRAPPCCLSHDATPSSSRPTTAPADLRDTLESLAAPSSGRRLGSHRRRQQLDRRRRAPSSERRGRGFPAPLRYLFEQEQGRSPALNAGIRHAQGDIIVTTDDDVRVETDWLDRAREGLDAPRLRLRRRPGAADLGRAAAGVAAESRRQALGGDRAARLRTASRSSSARACRWASTWRSGATRSSAPACSTRTPAARPARCSARKCASGAFARGRPALRGFYVPEMVVRHIIPAARLNKAYFRRWFYWRGISRAML